MFDQYLEMIMTFGYITMFAAAFPFGATLTSLFIYLETKSDMFNLARNTRRPFNFKTTDIGVWEYTLDFFTFVSIFTNIWLCCFASNQIDPLLPWLNLENKKSTSRFTKNSLATMFTIEHVLLFGAIMLRIYLSSDPEWLKIFKQRKVHRKFEKRVKVAAEQRQNYIKQLLKQRIYERFAYNATKDKLNMHSAFRPKTLMHKTSNLFD